MILNKWENTLIAPECVPMANNLLCGSKAVADGLCGKPCCVVCKSKCKKKFNYYCYYSVDNLIKIYCILFVHRSHDANLSFKAKKKKNSFILFCFCHFIFFYFLHFTNKFTRFLFLQPKTSLDNKHLFFWLC